MPDPLLERSAPHVERQIEPRHRCLDEAHDLRHQRLELLVAADERSPREPVLEIADEGLGIVAQEDRAHAALASGHQMAPSEHWPTAKWISVPLPPERKSVGRIPSSRVGFS